MRDRRKTKDQLLIELATLRQRIAQLESLPSTSLSSPPTPLAAGAFNQTLVNTLPEAITLSDLSGAIVFANAQTARLHGYEQAEALLGLNVFDLIAAADRERAAGQVRAALAGGTAIEVEVELLRRDGQTFLAQLTVTALRDAQGVPQAVIGLTRDITVRKQAEEAVQRLTVELEQRVAQRTLELETINNALQDDIHQRQRIEDMLRRSEQRYRTLFESAGDAIFIVDLTGHVLEANHMACLQLGYAHAELLGMPLSRFDGSPEAMSVEDRICRLRHEGEQVFEAVHVRCDGGLLPVEIKAAIVEYAGGPAILATVRDVTDRKRAEHDLRRYADEQAAIALENAQLYEQQQAQYRHLQDAQARLIQSEKMSALGRLIASISHEINNPLQAVLGCLALVREGIEETPALDAQLAADWQQDLAVASGEVQRIAGIVQRLRDFYRPARPGWQAVEVLGALDSVLALTAKQLQHSRITVEQVRLTPLLTITSNADQLKQIMLNLVLNAIDALPDGGRLRVTTGLDEEHSPGQVRMDFTDNGQGIAPENLARIFEPFFTTKDTGSGLGLTISYELIKALGGDITVTSEVGQGSTFSLYLPLDGSPGRKESI